MTALAAIRFSPGTDAALFNPKEIWAMQARQQSLTPANPGYTLLAFDFRGPVLPALL
jgi:hypothetical protein